MGLDHRLGRGGLPRAPAPLAAYLADDLLLLRRPYPSVLLLDGPLSSEPIPPRGSQPG